MTKTIRTLTALLMLVLASGLLPSGVLAAAPDAVDDSVTVAEDSSPTAVDVLVNDSDPESDTLTITGVTDGAKGVVAITGGGTGLTYDPDTNANGADSFTYTISDGNGGNDTATVAVTITPANDDPLATDDSITIAEDSGATSVDVLANDDDIDGDTLLVSDRTNGTKGVVVITGGGTGLTYDPDTNASGADSFTYTISDGNGGTGTATVTVTITPSNDDPVAGDDSITVAEDSGATAVDVLTNDSDPDGDPLDITSRTNGSKGDVEITGGGTGLTYSPDPNASGPDTFDYTISDGNGGTDTATVTVTITPSNDNPVAIDDALIMNEDASATAVPVLGNDEDIDGDTLTITARTNGDKGLVTITGGGTGLTYKPNKDLNGSDSFTYTISDGKGGSDTGTVDVTINPVNDDPVAVTDSKTVAEDSGPTAINVLANDSDIEGDDLDITGKTNGAKGVVAITGGGSGLTYQPNPNANGSDTFTYTIDDDNGGTAIGTVNVTITPANDPPTADDDSITLAEDAPATAVPVLVGDADIDGDTLTITAKSDAAKGVVTITGGGTGLTYKPNKDLNGADSFTYTISDGKGGTAIATVSVVITPVNDAPVAVTDSKTVAEDSAATAINVLANDTDIEGDTLAITAKTNGTKGVVTITGGGTGLTYKPYVGFSGPDTFTYTISDGHGGNAVGTVTITITGINDKPSAVNDGSMTVPEGAGPTALAVLANDSDPDGDTLKITAVTNGTLGTVAITGGGTGLTYDPAPLKKGTDTFTYTVSDGRGGTDSATVLVTITPDTTPPVISGLSWSILTGTLGSQVRVRLAWTASDPGSGISSYTLQRSLNGAAYATIGPPSATAGTYDWDLTPGSQYRFRIRATDREKNTSSYVDWPTAQTMLYQESSTTVTLTGVWSSSTNSKMSGGAGRFSNSAAARAKAAFTGRDVAWVTTRTTGSGRAHVFIDGVYQTTIDLKASATKYKQIVFSKHYATSSTRVLEIRPIGDGRVDVDAIVTTYAPAAPGPVLNALVPAGRCRPGTGACSAP